MCLLVDLLLSGDRKGIVFNRVSDQMNLQPSSAQTCEILPLTVFYHLKSSPKGFYFEGVSLRCFLTCDLQTHQILLKIFLAHLFRGGLSVHPWTDSSADCAFPDGAEKYK